jgi:hypothetical protein
MNFDFSNNKDIDLSQEFLPVYASDQVDTIYRFSIFRTTGNNLFPAEGVEYFSILDSETLDMALLGIKYILHGKTLQIKSKLCITQGDQEVMQLVTEELVERLVQKRMLEIKQSRNKPRLKNG